MLVLNVTRCSVYVVVVVVYTPGTVHIIDTTLVTQ